MTSLSGKAMHGSKGLHDRSDHRKIGGRDGGHVIWLGHTTAITGHSLLTSHDGNGNVVMAHTLAASRALGLPYM